MPITTPVLALPLLLFLLLPTVFCFTFRSPTVSYADPTINTATQYVLTLQRQFTSALTPTPYASQAVPAGSTITVTFPGEFRLTGGETCDYVIIDGAMVYGYGVGIDTLGGVVTVSGAILTGMFIETVVVAVSNVINPFPAIVTGPFLATIGNDVSAIDSSAAATLSPASLAALAVTFTPSTVNTTGSMQVTVTTTNLLPADSILHIIFNSLNWVN